MFYLEDKSSAMPCSFARVYSEIINTKKNLSTDLFTAGRMKEDVLRKDFPSASQRVYNYISENSHMSVMHCI